VRSAARGLGCALGMKRRECLERFSSLALCRGLARSVQAFGKHRVRYEMPIFSARERGSPASAFFRSGHGEDSLKFCFPRRDHGLDRACVVLRKLHLLRWLGNQNC
jgi:hypothetical protein